MRKVLLTCLSMLVLTGMAKSKKQVVETWPDGTPMDAWFQQATKVDVNTLGKQYVLTDYGVLANSPEVQTQKIQAVIDRCAQEESAEEADIISQKKTACHRAQREPLDERCESLFI